MCREDLVLRDGSVAIFDSDHRAVLAEAVGIAAAAEGSAAGGRSNHGDRLRFCFSVPCLRGSLPGLNQFPDGSTTI